MCQDLGTTSVDQKKKNKNKTKQKPVQCPFKAYILAYILVTTIEGVQVSPKEWNMLC